MAKYERDTFLWHSYICIKNFPLSPQRVQHIAGLFFLFVLSFHLDGIEKNCIFAVDNTTENNEETIIDNSYRSAGANH